MERQLGQHHSIPCYGAGPGIPAVSDIGIRSSRYGRRATVFLGVGIKETCIVGISKACLMMLSSYRRHI